MHLQSATLQNLRNFESLTWSLEPGTDVAGWHVILGPNGSGKSSFLRALALGLIGPQHAGAARLDIPQFVRYGEKKARIHLNLQVSPGYDKWAEKGKKSHASEIEVALDLNVDGTIKAREKESRFSTRTVWGPATNGWFSAGFGPFRRFSGGNPENIRLYNSHPKLARHLSLFGEDVALTEALEWLRDLKFKQLELSGKSVGNDKRDPLVSITEFINQPGFLPYDAKLTSVTSDSVIFEDGNGVELPVLQMSDGYRSILSMTFELIRLMMSSLPLDLVFNKDRTKILVPGVVLIDEVDVHLHPNWQRTIGPWLCEHFPNIQFIVTTHSSFVCQQALKGSVWRLPDPGEEGTIVQVQGEELARLTLGDATLALETHAFGLRRNRSDYANALMNELASLNVKDKRDHLSATEIQRRTVLVKLLEPVLPGASNADD